MNNVEALRKLVLDTGDVPDPEVAKVIPQVRTNIIVPRPTWIGRTEDEEDQKASET